MPTVYQVVFLRFHCEGNVVMIAPVVHFEIIGTNPTGLRFFYKELFGWTGELSETSDVISDEGQYSFIEPIPVPGGAGIAGGIGGGPTRVPKVLFYVGVQMWMQRARR
jgi:predicted enzyme related to lactoylglutathione lyase